MKWIRLLNGYSLCMLLYIFTLCSQFCNDIYRFFQSGISLPPVISSVSLALGSAAARILNILGPRLVFSIKDHLVLSVSCGDTPIQFQLEHSMRFANWGIWSASSHIGRGCAVLAVYYTRAHPCTANYICRIFCCPFVREALNVLFVFRRGFCNFVVFNHWYLDEMTWQLSSGNFNGEERDFYFCLKKILLIKGPWFLAVL